MQKVIDPVCGMSVDPATAAGQSKFEGRDYYFCSKACQQEFEKNPSKYRHSAEYEPLPRDRSDSRR